MRVFERGRNFSNFVVNSRKLWFPLLQFMFLISNITCRYDSHPCTRICLLDDEPMTCYYKFSIEKYYTMSSACYNCPYNTTDCLRPDCIPADGFQRLVTVVNRQIPGPSIQVCKGDTIIVDVANDMTEESTSIHWHGIQQKGTPYMDGVPHITQCPIQPESVFKYKFRALMTGTHFYHSHTGSQRGDGLFGSLIIRQPKIEEAHGYLYDYDEPDHIMILTDWIHRSGGDKFAYHYSGLGDNKPDTLLINGMGMKREFRKRNVIEYTPLARFNIRQGKRYRFRVINAEILYCPIEISIDGHPLIIIGTDGENINPIVYADSLVIYAGERWDFIINANNHIDNYWIKMKGLGDCDQRFTSAFQLAVLHYEGAPDNTPHSKVTYNNIENIGIQLNPLNIGRGIDSFITVADITNDLLMDDLALKPKADITLMLAFDFYGIDNSLFHKSGLYGYNQVSPSQRRMLPQINHVSMKMPSFPILSQTTMITNDTFCNLTDEDDCANKFCSCTYKIDIPLNTTVEIVFVDEGKPYEANHPMHLHGHAFRVVAMEKLGNSTTREEVQSLLDEDKVIRNLFNPPIKDTVTVPDGGFTVVRFYADNPGYWLLHCHLDFHVEVGMAVVLKVGEHKDFAPIPKHFPVCGDYPKDKDEEEWSSHYDINSIQENNIIAYKETDDLPSSSSRFSHMFSDVQRVIKSIYSYFLPSF